jgi:hypothetical protein
MADTLDDLVGAAVRTWATVARTWIEAANTVLVGWLDVADAESMLTGFNEEVVLLPRQQAATALHAGPFTDWDQNQLRPAALTVEPAQVNAGEVTEVRVKVQPPHGTASGTYRGSLYDPTGACLLKGVDVYVVGDRPPP